MTTPVIKNVTIVGAGTMGHSIGQEFALAGFQVHFFDENETTRSKVMGRIEKNLNEMTEWELIEEKDVAPALSRIKVHADLGAAVKSADLVIEAVFEILEVKQDVFRRLDQLCPPHTILVSNTSSLMPSSLAAVTNRPEQVLVLHYFYPPHLMPLVEIVKSDQTAQECADAVYDAVIKAGKKPIITQKEALGFVVNRLQSALLREALYIIEAGIATAEDIDTSVKYSFGRRLAHVGPIELSELQDGWFQMGQIQKYIYPDLSNAVGPTAIIEEKIRDNHLGPQTGQGFYNWAEGSVARFERHLYEKLAAYIRADRSAKASLPEKGENNSDKTA